ncbi:DUF2306 domain-containing protein [Algoriphagus halophytocola]|uniref:DUF2306 domain-containing protein n=1 Tax=Algoriphagus halophytocola TaxID=2991499 RepID=A0ABY6MCE0_9BACT|nr:DUF2306 domain-containing protein [Algoriphagus sp. TR-M5]UZD21353.1 DUF2306 domain-containing protein [Algoriphagus sp. TR-M5]
MNYDILMFSHLATVVPCIFLGAYLLFAKKGGLTHRNLGALYMSLMLITAVIALFIEAQVGDRLFNHFGYIHLFCLLVFWTVPTAFLSIKKGKVKTHQRKMILLYVGAIILAGGFTLAPGRYLHGVFFGG